MINKTIQFTQAYVTSILYTYWSSIRRCGRAATVKNYNVKLHSGVVF